MKYSPFKLLPGIFERNEEAQGILERIKSIIHERDRFTHLQGKAADSAELESVDGIRELNKDLYGTRVAPLYQRLVELLGSEANATQSILETLGWYDDHITMDVLRDIIADKQPWIPLNEES